MPMTALQHDELRHDALGNSGNAQTASSSGSPVDAHVQNRPQDTSQEGTQAVAIDRVLNMVSELVSVASEASGVKLNVNIRESRPSSAKSKHGRHRDDRSHVSVEVSERAKGVAVDADKRGSVNFHGRICGDSPRVANLMDVLARGLDSCTGSSVPNSVRLSSAPTDLDTSAITGSDPVSPISDICHAELKELRSVVDNFRRENHALEEEVVELRRHLEFQTCEKSRWELQTNELDSLRRDLKELRSVVDNLRRENHALEEEVVELRRHLEFQTSEKSRLELQTNELDSLRREKNDKLESQERVIVELRRALDWSWKSNAENDLMQEKEDSKKLQELRDTIVQRDKSFAELQGKSQHLLTRNGELESLLADKNDELSKLQEQILALPNAQISKAAQLEKTLEECQMKLMLLNERLDVPGEDIKKVRHRFEEQDRELMELGRVAHDNFQAQAQDLARSRQRDSEIEALQKEVTNLKGIQEESLAQKKELLKLRKIQDQYQELEHEVVSLKTFESRFRDQETELAELRKLKEFYKDQQHEIAELRVTKDRFEEQCQEIEKLRRAQEESLAQEKELLGLRKIQDQYQELEHKVAILKTFESRFREQETELAELRNLSEFYQEQDHELAELRDTKDRFEEQSQEIGRLRRAQERYQAQERELMDVKHVLGGQVQENLKVLQERQERFDAQDNELRLLRAKLGNLQQIDQKEKMNQAQLQDFMELQRFKRESILSLDEKERSLQAQDRELIELRKVRDMQSRVLDLQREELEGLRRECQTLSAQQDDMISDKTLVALPYDSVMRTVRPDAEYFGMDRSLQSNCTLPSASEQGNNGAQQATRQRAWTSRGEHESSSHAHERVNVRIPGAARGRAYTVDGNGTI